MCHLSPRWMYRQSRRLPPPKLLRNFLFSEPIFFGANARMQVTVVIINAAVAHAEILQCWLGRRGQRCKTSVMKTRAKTFQCPASLFVGKRIWCVTVECAPSERLQFAKILEKASAVTFGALVEH